MNVYAAGCCCGLMSLRKDVFAAGCCCGRAGTGRHSGGFLLRIMPPSWHPVPACTPRLRCRRAVLNCSSDDAAAIRKSVLEIMNRCSLWAVLEGFLASIPKSGLEIKNHCTQEDISGQNMQRFASLGLKSRIDAALALRRLSAGGPFFFAAAKIRIGRGSRCCHASCRLAVLLCCSDD